MMLEANSFAKINLFLHILGKRVDGYHDIYTLFLPISLHDNIKIELSDKTELLTNSHELQEHEENIIIKTDNILRNEYNLTDYFKITLDKKIPIGAGLGGGSSNAATYMNMVNMISKLNLTMKDKVDIMKSLGSDTVFFIEPKPSIGKGRGENLSPIKIDFPIYILLINPKISISTKEAYSNLNFRLTDKKTVSNIIDIGSFDILKSVMENDFEYSIFSRYNEIKNVVDELNKFDTTSKAMMTGTGSTVFAVYSSADKRDLAYKYFNDVYKEYIVISSDSINSAFKEG